MIAETGGLVLSRKVGEAICLPTVGIRVEVVAIRGRNARLRIVAPNAVRVYREEILTRALAQLTGSEAENALALAPQ